MSAALKAVDVLKAMRHYVTAHESAEYVSHYDATIAQLKEFHDSTLVDQLNRAALTVALDNTVSFLVQINQQEVAESLAEVLLTTGSAA